MSDQGSVQGKTELSRSGSATLLKKTKAPSRDHQSHIHFGDQPSDFISCSAAAFCPMPPKTAKEAAALHDNKKYLRGVHWTLGGDSDPTGVSTAQAAYKPPGPAPRDAMFGDKTSNQKTQWSMGFDDAPNHYETCHQAELSEPALLRGQSTGPGDHKEAIAMARSTTITLGSDAPDYQSLSRAAHIDFGKQVAVDPKLAFEKCKMMRVTNFTFGAGDEIMPTRTESQNQFKFHGDPHSLKGQLVAEIPGGGTKGLQKTHLCFGMDKPQMKSEFQKSFGNVNDLLEAAKNPSKMDDATKADLRHCHFYLGTDTGVSNSDYQDAFGARATRPGGEKALADERNQLSAIRADLRATHINLGTDNTKDITSTARDAYSAPLGKKVGGRMEEGKKEDPYRCNWSLGVDDASLQQLRGTSMQHQDFADGIAKVNYSQGAAIDEKTKAELRKSHFYFGKESFPKQSCAREAFVPHKHRPHVIDPELLKDLRKEHFSYGTDEGLSHNSKSTSAEAMIYHGAQAYRSDSNSAANMKKLWAKSNYNPGSHDGPKISVQQADYKFRPGL